LIKQEESEDEKEDDEDEYENRNVVLVKDEMEERMKEMRK
jgi:hypothetical protein